MQGITDLLSSERGVFCIVIVVTAGVLAGLGTITGGDWLDFAKWITMTLVASKTVTGVAELVRKKPDAGGAPQSTAASSQTSQTP